MKMGAAIVHSAGEVRSIELFLSSEALKKAPSSELIFQPDVLGRLKRELQWSVGENHAAGIFTRLGVSLGQADLLDASSHRSLIQGLGALSTVGGNDEEILIQVADSVEAQQFLRFTGGPSLSAQCWLLTGYLTGVFSVHTDHTVYFVETKCVGKGDERCVFEGKSRKTWEGEVAAGLKFYEEENIALDLEEALEQLKLTKDRYQNLFEQASVPIFIIDPDSGAYLDANIAAEELTGHPREKLLQMNVFDLCPNKEHHHLIDAMKTLLHDGKIADQELSIVRSDGQSRIVSQSSKLMSYGGQRVIQSVLRDITDLKTSEQKEKDLQSQLLRSERLSSIGRLAAGVAHELKNPLGAIKNAIYYIRNSLVNTPALEADPELKNIIKLAESEVDGSVTIIGELLDFSRVVSLVPRKTNVNELLEEIPNVVVIPNNIELILDLDPQLPSAMIDPDRIRQVLINIINNALQAMAQGGKLRLKTSFEIATFGNDKEQKNMVSIMIEDTGCGIAAWHLTKIFEPLFTTKARGTGLGLAISNNIVEKHGGVIQVTSQQGKGTTFFVKLPLEQPADKED